MKKLTIILLIATFTMVIVAISFFLSRDKESDLLSKVPANANSIIVIDAQTLSTKLFIDELASDTKSADKLSKMIPDSLADIDLSVSGISLFDKIVLFTTQNTYNYSISVNLILRIENIEKFNEFIDNLAENTVLDVVKKEKERFAWSKRYKMAISWNKNFVVASFLSENPIPGKKNLNKILALKKEESIMMDSSFMNKQAADFDMLLYSLPYSLHPIKYQQFIQSNIKSVFLLLKFNDGKLEIQTDLFVKKESLLEKLFSIAEKKPALLKILDSSALSATLNVNPYAFFQIIEQYSSVKLNRKKMPHITAWDGRTNFNINGIKYIEKEYISYEFDDDFNKIEVKKTIIDKVWDIEAILGVNKLILDSVLQQTRIHKSKKDTLLFKGSNFVIKKAGNSYLCFNKHFNRPEIWERSKIDNISIDLDYSKFIPLLNEFGINSDSLWLNKLAIKKFELTVNQKENINISCSIYFADKEKNSLFSIVDRWE